METKDNYVAYVSSYTSGNKTNMGIGIYDVDVKNGRMSLRDQIEITNSSYLTISHNRKFLYSITDFGVESYEILPDGNLKILNKESINGMRGCYLSTDYEDKLLFVVGYHDAKLTVLRLNPDGSVGEITDEIFHKGLGSIAERNYRPHLNCVKMTRDNKYLLVADLGMDHIVVYEVNHTTGKLKQVDIIHSEQESAPRHLKFSKDGKFLYVVHELKSYIDVYTYDGESHVYPQFEKIQSISTLNDYHASVTSASALNWSFDFKYMISTNAGDNSVIIYSADSKTGLLEKIVCLPVSGDYPKDAMLFPDNKHLVSLNHETNSMTFFSFDDKNKTIVMNGKELKVNQPNCIIFYKL